MGGSSGRHSQRSRAAAVGALAIPLICWAGAARAQPAGISAGVKTKTGECLGLLNEGQLQEALARCNDALREDPRYGPARLLKVRALVATKAYASAVAEARAAAGTLRGEDAAELESWRGLALVKLARYEEARVALEAAAAGRPADALTHLQLCKLHAMRGMQRYAKRSIAACEAYLTHRPNEEAWTKADAEALLWKAYAHRAGGDYAPMQAACTEMERRAVTPVDKALAQVCSVRAMALSGNCGGAIASGQRLLKTRNPQVYQALISCYLRRGEEAPGALERKLAEARRIGAEYRLRQKDDPRAWIFSSLVEFAAGRSKPAVELLKQAEQVTRNPAERLSVSKKIASVYLENDNPLAAEEQLRAILRFAPQDPEVRHQLGRLIAKREPPAALAFLAEAARLAPTIPLFCLDHGAALRSGGELPKAVREHQRCTEIAGISGTDLDRAWLELASDHYVAKQLDEAIEIYGRLAGGRGQADSPARKQALEGLTQSLIARAFTYLPTSEGGGDLAAASRQLELAEAKNPGQTAVLHNLAVVRLLQERPAEAVALLAPVFGGGGTRDPAGDADVRAAAHVYARGLEAIGNLPAAAQVLRRFSDPAALGPILDHAAILLRLRRPEEALGVLSAAPARLKTAPEIERSLAVCQLHRAAQLYGSDEPSAATTSLLVSSLGAAKAAARHLEPRERGYLNGLELLVLLRSSQGRGLAQKARTYARSVAPDVAESLLGRGGLSGLLSAAAYADQDYEGAAQLAQKELAHLGTRGDEEARARDSLKQILGFSLLAQGAKLYNHDQPAKASEKIKRAAQLLDGDMDELRFAQAVLDYSAGRRDSGVRALRNVNPRKIPEAYANLGIAADDTGDYRAAYDLFRRYVQSPAAKAPRVKHWLELKEKLYALEAAP